MYRLIALDHRYTWKVLRLSILCGQSGHDLRCHGSAEDGLSPKYNSVLAYCLVLILNVGLEVDNTNSSILTSLNYCPKCLLYLFKSSAHGWKKGYAATASAERGCIPFCPHLSLHTFEIQRIVLPPTGRYK